VNTADFRDSLKAVVKAQVKQGITDAEGELNVDIGFGPSFDSAVESFTQRQMDGFAFDGGSWQGLKGTAKAVQTDISKAVMEGIVEKQSMSDIKQSIKDIFNKQTGTSTTEGKATMIARTESNRIHNESKLGSYKESGLKGVKVWDSFLDERTSGICKELHGQKVPVEKPFTLKDGREFMSPPSHPSCRSVVMFELE